VRRYSFLSMTVCLILISMLPASANLPSSLAPEIKGAVKGGELVLYRTRDFRSFDPVRFFNTHEVAFGSFLFRSLTQFQTINGKTELLPDLATDLGRPSKDFKTWTFKLRQGIKYSDGSTVVCEDIKYNVMRSFADDVLTQGPPYAKLYLQTKDNYRGPYNEPQKDLKSVVCNKSNSEIVFNLNRPVTYFNLITAFPVFSPVPKRADTKLDYGRKPLSTGPYQLQEWIIGQQATLVRNPKWNPSTDPVRWNFPERITVKVNLQQNFIEQALISDNGEAQRAATMQVPIVQNRKQVNNLTNLLNRSKSINFDPMFLAINADTIQNINVRKAIQCAIDYRSVVAAAGGQQYNKYVSTIVSKTMKDAYRTYNLCGRNVQKNPQAQTQEVSRLLANVPASQKQIRFAYSDAGDLPLIASAIANSLQRAGFTVIQTKVPALLYQVQVRDRNSNPFDLMLREAYLRDWQLASGYVYPILDGRQMSDGSSGPNWSRQNFAEIQKLFVKADNMINLAKQEKLLGDIEQLATEKYAVLVPLIERRAIYLYGSKLGGIEISSGYNVLTFASAYIKK